MHIKRVKSFLLLILLMGLLPACSVRIVGLFNSVPGMLNFTSVSPVASYTCAPITITVSPISGGSTWIATANTSVALSGLGSGSAYSTLANCQTGTSASATVFISAGSSSVTFYYRTSVAESLTFSASGTLLTSATTPVSTVLFQTLGQSGPTHVIQFEKGLSGPSAVSTDGTRLFLADSGNNRILIWNTIPANNTQLPDLILGQPNLTVVGPANTTSASTLNGPAGVFSNGTQLFVADNGNNRVLIWNSFPTSNGQAADVVLGQPDMASTDPNNGGLSASTMTNPSSIVTHGTKLFVSDTGNNRILVWNTIPTINGPGADFALGQPDLVSGDEDPSGYTASSLGEPNGLLIVGTKLLVADSDNGRVLIWNTLPTAMGQDADVAVGQNDLISYTTGLPDATHLESPQGLASDGTRLFVTDSNFERVLVWNNIPTSDGQAMDSVLGASALTQRFSDPYPTAMNIPYGVATTGTNLFVADAGLSRLLIWKTLPTTIDQVADFAWDSPI